MEITRRSTGQRPDSHCKAQISLSPTAVTRLWFCIWLPNLPLEACRSSEAALAIVEEQHGIHRILQADAVAAAVGVMPGQSANAALALLPTLTLEERSLLRDNRFSNCLLHGWNVFLRLSALQVRMFC
jgi:hypothetical protein